MSVTEKREPGWARKALRRARPAFDSRKDDLDQVVALIERLPLSPFEEVSMHFIQTGREYAEVSTLTAEKVNAIEDGFPPEVRGRVLWKEFCAHMGDEETSEDAERMVTDLRNQYNLTLAEMLFVGMKGIERANARREYDNKARKIRDKRKQTIASRSRRRF